MVEYLLSIERSLVDVNHFTSSDCKTPLHLAVSMPEETVRAFSKRKKAIRFTEEEEDARILLVDMLLRSGASLNAPSDCAGSPLFSAGTRKYTEFALPHSFFSLVQAGVPVKVLRYLVENGAESTFPKLPPSRDHTSPGTPLIPVNSL